MHKLDHWLEMTVPMVETLQDIFPGQIVEYGSLGAVAEGKDAGKGKRMLPREARVVCFPLEPKPHQVKEAWIQRMWRGHEDERR